MLIQLQRQFSNKIVRYNVNTGRNTSLKELPLDTFNHKPDLYRFCILENYEKIRGNGLLSNWSLTTKYF